MLALLGWHTSDNREIFSVSELTQLFSIEKISKNGAKFDPEKAKWFNHQHLMLKDNADIARSIMDEVEDMGFDTDINFLTKVVGLVKEKVNFRSEIPTKSIFFFKAPESYDEQVIAKRWSSPVANYLAKFANELTAMSSMTAVEIENRFKEGATAEGINPGSLMQPLRVALSGEAGGPPLFEMLKLLGVEESAKRIQTAVNTISKTA